MSSDGRRSRERDRIMLNERMGGTEQHPRPQGGRKFPCPLGLWKTVMADVTFGPSFWRDHYIRPHVQRINSNILLSTFKINTA